VGLRELLKYIIAKLAVWKTVQLIFIYKVTNMKKSELRNLIREVLQEELAKTNILTEAPVDIAPDKRSRPNPVLRGGYEDLAFKIHQSDEFLKAFKADGNVVGDKVYAIIKDTAIVQYPKATPQELEKAVNSIARIIRDFAKEDDRDSDFYDWRKDNDLDKYYKDTHDIFGNEY
jgi:hypothetical protein